MGSSYDDIINSVYKDFFGKEIKSEADKKNAFYNAILEGAEHGVTLIPDPDLTDKNGISDTNPVTGSGSGYSNSDLDKTLDELTSKIYGDGPKPSAFSGPGTTKSEEEAIAAQKKAEEKAKKEPETDPMEDLNSLTGLTTVKNDVKELINFVKTQKIRKDKGMKTVPVSLHLVFSGNPGTGKTTVARILARLYKKIGVLSKGQLVEVDRSNLVAGYVGQTAIQTQAKIQEAKGGVLFIDEAYTLAGGNQTDFGQEAIDTVLKAMEDNREDFVVIVAGYTDLMKKFINSNPGLKSRFNKYLEFPDYTAEELTAIFEGNLKKYEYTITDDCKELVKKHLKDRTEHKDKNFANAREVRNYFEEIITNQASRIADIEDPDTDTLSLITADDLPEGERPEKPAAKNPSGTELQDKADAAHVQGSDQTKPEENPSETGQKEDTEN